MTALLQVDPTTRGNESFSHKLPGMQLALDSTSLGEFKTCPRKYYYSIIRGLTSRGGNVHLQFGLWMHEARERYEHLRVTSPELDHDERLDLILDWALKVTWNEVLGRPWISGHDIKTRQSLIQSIVWYLDASGRDDPFETLILANGKPAVELSFRFDSGLRTQAQESIIFCGHIDRIAKLNDTPYIKDIKTTSMNPDSNWARREFTPGNQFSMYAFAGKVGLAVETAGVIVDGIQVGVTFSRFGTHLVPRDAAMLEEWFENTAITIESMEDCASRGYWPMNETSCSKYGGCVFQGLCARSPASRELWIPSEFDTRGDGGWDPLKVRGDI